MRPRLALAPLLALSLTGCAELIEGNIKAVETLTSDEATSRDKGLATALVGGTIGAAVVLGVVGTIAATTDWSPDEPPPTDYVSDELGWSFEQRGDEATWFRCTSRIFCTEERVTVPIEDLVGSSTIGRTVPVAMGGTSLPEVDLVALQVRRRK